jgi:NCK-associated protein 1
MISYPASSSPHHPKKKKKHSECLAAVVGGTLPTRHKDRRVYLRQELSNFVQLIEEYPGLLGPKMQVIVSGLHLAKEEVVWYYRHRAKQAPKSNAKHPKEDEFRDERVIELIYLLHKLLSLIQSYRHVITAYYVEYMATTDQFKLSELVESMHKERTLNNTVGSAFNSLVQTLAGLSLDAYMEGTQSDLQGYRRDWLRLEAMLSSTSTPLPLEIIPEVVGRLNLIQFHSQYVDSLDAYVGEIVSLRELYGFKEVVLEEFHRAVENNSPQTEHVCTLFQLLDQFPSIATQYNPEEKEAIGREVVELGQQFIQHVSTKLSSLVGEITRQYISFDNQTAPNNVVFKAKEYKPDRNAPLPVEPASESEYKSRTQIEPLRLQLRSLSLLFSTLNQSFTVFNTVFSPITVSQQPTTLALFPFFFFFFFFPSSSCSFSF